MRMTNPNSVCFVAKIEQINNIENADKIVQAIIGGWECVIQKEQFNIGDLVVVAVTDAIIPFELAEKLSITKYLKHRKRTEQYTVKTTKLKGVYSTATIIGTAYDFVTILSEGTDMMDFYKIYKYEEPDVQMITSSGKRIRYHKNPNFHIYYKFPNSKNAPGMFNENDDVVYTRKYHGTNARYGIVKKNKPSLWDRIKRFFGGKYIDYDFVYGSHNIEKGSSSQGFYSEDVWKRIADSLHIKEKLEELYKNPKWIGRDMENIILYGEIYGPGIQKYYEYGEKELKIRFFDIEINGEYVDRDTFSYIIRGLGWDIVDVLYTGKFNEELVSSFHSNIPNTKVPHEGVVVASVDGSRNKIAKYINPAYLEFQSKKEDSTDFH